jgi:Class II Aldolase and Adducin N-terminal domain
MPSVMSVCAIPRTKSSICCRAPELVEAKDIVTYRLDGEPADAKKAEGLAPYIERFIHVAIYEARLDVQSVVHNHSPSTIPFGVHRHRAEADPAMCARSGTRCRCGIRRMASATRRFWSTAWRWGSSSPSGSGLARRS